MSRWALPRLAEFFGTDGEVGIGGVEHAQSLENVERTLDVARPLVKVGEPGVQAGFDAFRVTGFDVVGELARRQIVVGLAFEGVGQQQASTVVVRILGRDSVKQPDAAGGEVVVERCAGRLVEPSLPIEDVHPAGDVACRAVARNRVVEVPGSFVSPAGTLFLARKLIHLRCRNQIVRAFEEFARMRVVSEFGLDLCCQFESSGSLEVQRGFFVAAALATTLAEQAVCLFGLAVTNQLLRGGFELTR